MKHAIQIHGGFMVKEYVEKFRNCMVTTDVAEALKFDTAEQANAFIIKNDGNGLSKKTAVVIPVA